VPQHHAPTFAQHAGTGRPPATTGSKLFEYSELRDEAWAHLARGASGPLHAMHLVTLATVGVDNRPGARILVLRGADRASGRLWFHTDRRSPKVADLRANPYACVVAYDHRDGVQMRLSGTASLHESDAVADRHWEQLEATMRYLYIGPHDPGKEILSTDPRLPRNLEDVPASMTLHSRTNFAVIQVQIESIDWFQVVGGAARRAVMQADSDWSVRSGLFRFR